MPMLWDFSETNPLVPVSGSFHNHLNWVVRYVEHALIAVGESEGPVIMHMAQSMYVGSPRVAILSACEKRLTYQDVKAGRPPELEKFYHQVFDTKELKPVGVPIPLSFETDDSPKGVWAGRDSYVVYTDMLHEKVQIVHMFRMPSDEG